MSDASDRLAQSRRAILDRIQGRERGPDARARERERQHERDHPYRADEHTEQGSRWRRSGWFGSARHAIGTWWRHHPAHMGLEIATPVLSAYAERKPLQYLGIAAAIGAVAMVVRPWRLVSAGGLLMALLKSSQLSGVLMSALSAADFEKDGQRPYE